LYFISAPFGNYLKFKNTISVTGTWTVNPRPGLMKQLFKTLRYVNTEQGRSWRNKIGLRNPGLKAGMLKTNYDQVLSVAAIDIQDWGIIRKMISPDRCIELNVSCPNLDTNKDTTAWPEFDKFPTHMRNKWCIVKVPPKSTNKLIDKIVDMGYNQIHASNTLPTEQGGLSGKVLVPYTMKLIDYIKNKHQHVEVIAGGGVNCKQQAEDYLNAGADHISIGSACFTPWKIKNIVRPVRLS
tara:strand:- start:171 stop:887 length:717 start_codon:yes stop_codon:yes gene_type:complete